MEISWDIKGLTLKEMKDMVKTVKAAGRVPFYHYTQRAGDILNGPLINDIIGDLYATFDRRWHEAFIVPYKFKNEIEGDVEL